MQTNLKSEATKGMFWNSLEKISVRGSQFIFGVVLARLLVPADFGLIGMLAIFIAISQTFIDGGMGSGLIQRQERSNKDFSTVFVFNLVVSVLLYLLLFFLAPLIANFYKTPELVNITRVIGLNLIINSLAIVQRTRLTIDLDFKTLAKINVVSVLLSGGVAIYLAYIGFGVWALVCRQVLGAILAVLLLWYYSRWKPSLAFSRQSFKQLFGYGSKILAAGIYAQTFQNIYNITIGKVYTAGELGFYTQAKQFADVSAGTVTSILQQVTFPILASLQDNREKMIVVYRQLIKMTAFFIFFAMSTLAILAEPFIELFLGEKWLPTIPLLQWMCFARMFYPISALNLNMLNANGRSDLFLKVDLSKAPLIIIALVITIPISVKAMVIGQVITSFISFFINAYMPGKLYGYGPISQLKDIGPMILVSGVAALCSYLSTTMVDLPILKLLIGSIIAIVVYFGISYLLKFKEMEEVKILFNKLSKYKQ